MVEEQAKVMESVPPDPAQRTRLQMNVVDLAVGQLATVDAVTQRIYEHWLRFLEAPVGQ
jgi:hypothetical protein